jgi:hypothetical protein
MKMIMSLLGALIAATLMAFGNLLGLLLVPASIIGGMSDLAFEALLLGQVGMTVGIGALSALVVYDA